MLLTSTITFSHSQTPIFFLGHFNLPDICRRCNTAGSKQCSRFLKCCGGNFLTHRLRRWWWQVFWLDLLQTKRNWLGWEGQSSLGYSDHEMLEFRVLQGENKAKSRATTLEFRRNLLCLGICLEEFCEVQSWREESLEQLADFQGSSTSFKMFHPQVWEIKHMWQKSHVDEQVAAVKTHT